jgi:hypothetical protein
VIAGSEGLSIMNMMAELVCKPRRSFFLTKVNFALHFLGHNSGKVCL